MDEKRLIDKLNKNIENVNNKESKYHFPKGKKINVPVDINIEYKQPEYVKDWHCDNCKKKITNNDIISDLTDIVVPLEEPSVDEDITFYVRTNFMGEPFSCYDFECFKNGIKFRIYESPKKIWKIFQFLQKVRYIENDVHLVSDDEKINLKILPDNYLKITNYVWENYDSDSYIEITVETSENNYY